MIDAALAALEASPIAESLRASRYAYPLVNAAHILALAALFGSILALDLRLLGAWREVPIVPLARVLPRVSAGGLLFALVTGLALFSVQPFEYLAHPVFPVKLGLIAFGAVNALLLHRALAWRSLDDAARVPPRLKFAAGLSLVAWTGAIVAGRWLAF
ncbi:DUF2214 domain-containing protein [Qipengyuania sediminis]|uniref:DUF2214 domain-containing protein n=1 Tax=Qipengyuania sediminis TaxID=1532023 RepID=UPI001059728F|nr:DUF2214 domain-containing protein [Qipengyuania sediminis]